MTDVESLQMPPKEIFRSRFQSLRFVDNKSFPPRDATKHGGFADQALVSCKHNVTPQLLLCNNPSCEEFILIMRLCV